MSCPEILAPALRIIEATGPAGAILAALVVALVLGLVLAAWAVRIIAGARSESQAAAFQQKLLGALGQLTQSEEALRRYIDALSAENQTQQAEILELRVSLSLIRNQRRRLLEYLRDVRGKPSPEGAAE